MGRLFTYLSANPRTIFLVDGLGALLSTLLLFVIAYYEGVFGMPPDVLHQLMPVTTVFTAYSLATYFLNPGRWKRYLEIIAVANILYCCLTMALLVYYFDHLTKIGVTYFLAEVFLILLLSGIEFHLTIKGPNQQKGRSK
jgi:hypothetical protein